MGRCSDVTLGGSDVHVTGGHVVTGGSHIN